MRVPRPTLEEVPLECASNSCSLGGFGRGLLISLVNARESLFLADGVLGTTGISLELELGFTLGVGLVLVDEFDQDVFVLVHVTLSAEVHLSVLSTGDLLGLTVLAEESTEIARASHPKDLRRHTGVGSSLPASKSAMTSLSDSGVPCLASEARVDIGLLLFNDVVLNKLADVLAYKQ